MLSKINLSVIMPVFNEARTVREVIEKVKKSPLVKEFIIVDDGSTDGTTQLLEKLNRKNKIKVFFHKENQGKGVAIKTGLKEVTGDYVIIQDADLEYDPADFSKLLKPIEERKAEVVYGSRFTGEHRNMFFWHMLANKSLTLLTNILFDTTLSDMETCYKLIPINLIRQFKLHSKSFDFEPEITAKILKKGIRIYEVPISYAGREYSEGKKINWYDGFWAFLVLFYYRFFD